MASKSRDISGKAEEQMRKVSYTVDAAQYEIMEQARAVRVR